MKEKIKEALRRAKEGRESVKDINAQKTKKQKVIQRVLWSIGIGLFIAMILGYYLDLPTFAALTFLIWMCYLCPCAFFTDRIDHKAREKYKEDYVMEILEFCPHCGEKIEPPGTFCGYCGKKIEPPRQVERQKAETEERRREGYTMKPTPVPESPTSSEFTGEPVEVINMSRKSQFYSFIWGGAIIYIAFGLLFYFISLDLQFVLLMFLFLSLFGTIAMVFMGILFDYVFLHVKFKISHGGIEMFLENHLYLHVKWPDIESLEIYKVSFQGHFLKINRETSFEIIPFQKLTLSGKKRRKILEAIEHFATLKGVPITREKRLKPILEVRGINLIYEDIREFSKSHKYKRSPAD